MSGYSQEELANSLARIRQRKNQLAGNDHRSPMAQRDYRDGAMDYNEFAPQVMDTKILTNPFSSQLVDTVGKTSHQATVASGVQAENRFNYQRLVAEQKRLAQAKKNRVKLTKETIKTTPLVVPNVGPIGGATFNPNAPTPSTQPGSSYYTQTPGWVDPNSKLTTFEAGGHSWTLNSSVAERFRNFINALTDTGYTIKTAGSYSNRNQANGSGQKSLHAYGLAIDINAFGAGNSYNPGNAGVHKTNLPKGVSALAAKYGLVWGGDWRKSKDYMHFSVPYKGLM